MYFVICAAAASATFVFMHGEKKKDENETRKKYITSEPSKNECWDNVANEI